MTEKRYTTMWKPETTFSRFWIVRENWERKLNANDVVDLLNEQHEQIGRLKENFRALDEIKCELADENEQLKQQIGNLEHTRDFCAECCERLEKENEGLKFEIRKVQRAYEQLWEHTYK